MPGFHQLDEFTRSGLNFGSGDARLRVGHAKLMVTASSGRQTPAHSDLCRAVSSCATSGFPAAIHAVERESIISAAESIRSATSTIGRCAATSHRALLGGDSGRHRVGRAKLGLGGDSAGICVSQWRPLSEDCRIVAATTSVSCRRAGPRWSSACFWVGRARGRPESDARDLRCRNSAD